MGRAGRTGAEQPGFCDGARGGQRGRPLISTAIGASPPRWSAGQVCARPSASPPVYKRRIDVLSERGRRGRKRCEGAVGRTAADQAERGAILYQYSHRRLTCCAISCAGGSDTSCGSACTQEDQEGLCERRMRGRKSYKGGDGLGTSAEPLGPCDAARSGQRGSRL